MFSNVEAIEGVQAGESDSLGGFKVWDQDVYPFKIKIAYHEKSIGGANALTLVLHNPKTKEEYSESFWFTSGTAKGGKNTFTNDQGTQYLPGWNQCESLAQLLLDSPFGAGLEKGDKVIKKYNAEAGAEVNTTVTAFLDFADQEIFVAMKKVRENKQVKGAIVNGKQTYVVDLSGADRYVNQIDKIFSAETKLTSQEKLKGSEPKFMEAWKVKNAGPDKFQDKWKKPVAAPGAMGTPGAGQPAAAQAKNASAPTASSLFD